MADDKKMDDLGALAAGDTPYSDVVSDSTRNMPRLPCLSLNEFMRLLAPRPEDADDMPPNG
jgi:hypothetical protein